MTEDTSTATTFDMARPFHVGHSLLVEGCYGDFKVLRSHKAGALRLYLTSEIGGNADHPLRDYVSRVDLGDDGHIEVRTPKSLHAHVTLELPESTPVQVNWAHGNLYISQGGGDKKINLGAGDVRVYVRASDYADIDASVGWGSIKSQLPEDARSTGFLRSRNFSQRFGGKYHLELNVGAGHVMLLREE
jgi:hypothetical protein